MLTKDLIKQLQKLIDENDDEVLGEHTIVIDVFEKVSSGVFRYRGFSNDIVIDKSSDGVYDILSAFML